MDIKFSSPEEFLAVLQSKYSQVDNGAPPADKGFRAKNRKQARKIGFPIKSMSENGIDIVIKRAFEELVLSVNPLKREEVRKTIAAGSFVCAQPDAFISRSDNGKFAILVSTGLGTFINKYLKIVYAIHEPKSVAYCNRGSVHELSSDDYKSYLVEYIDYCRNHKIPRGVLLKLYEKHIVSYGMILYLTELFIVAHELGHYLNGDLSYLHQYCDMPSDVGGQRFVENVDHAREFKADLTAFKIYSDTIQRKKWSLSQEQILIPVMTMFDMFSAIGISETDSHPDPGERFRRIVNGSFDPILAQHIMKQLCR